MNNETSFYKHAIFLIHMLALGIETISDGGDHHQINININVGLLGTKHKGRASLPMGYCLLSKVGYMQDNEI
jgi:hypothetical protein